MSTIDSIMNEGKAAHNVLHQEECYYTQPLATLAALFGAENCHFAQCEGIDMLRLKPSGLTYSVCSKDAPPAAANDAWRIRLAHIALRALPPLRIGEMMYRRLVQHDPALGVNPFAMRFECRPLVPSALKPAAARKRKANADRALALDDFEEMKRELAHRVGCSLRHIRLETALVERDGRAYHACTVVAGAKRTFAPTVFYTMSHTAEHQSLLHALCVS